MNIQILEDLLQKEAAKVNDWFTAQENLNNHLIPAVFASIDIRNAGFKMGHVDTNLFPAGFNNLSPEGEDKAVVNFENYIQQHFSSVKKILVIPENFTRNRKYLENLYRLKEIIKQAGFEVLIGSPYITATERHHTPTHFTILALNRKDDAIITQNNWQPDLVLLNNDLTDDLPAILNGIAQPIIPSPEYGWHTRRKSHHFAAYSKLAERFAADFGFDSWLISSNFSKCSNVNFRERQGLEEIATAVDEVIAKTKIKYQEHNIKFSPYAFVKSDLGTYGMGVMSVQSGSELLELNKKARHSMQSVKYGIQNTELLIQEGIPTIEQFEGHTSETLAYVVGGEVVDLFSRVNAQKDNLSNLNSRGMQIINEPKSTMSHLKLTLARLATLAVCFENNSPATLGSHEQI